MTERRIAWFSGVAALWTFIAWGGRIGLLTGDEASNPWTWIRVGGSLLFGVALAGITITLLRNVAFAGWMARTFIGFGILMLIIWTRSSVSTLSSDDSTAFKLVHLVLALISIWLGTVLLRIGARKLRA